VVIRVMIMAGGTGGHVYPGLAVADALMARGAEVIWLGTREGIESRLVPAAGISVVWISISGLRGKSLAKRLLSPFRLALAMIQAAVVLLRYRPMAVLGMGGFVAGPGGLVTWLLRKPLLVHEQNAVVGLTNRLLAPLAKRLFEAFPGSFPRRYHAVSVGNPVRSSICQIELPADRFVGREGPLRLLVVGGSQGAQIFNTIVPKLLQQFSLADRPLVRHQTGERHFELTQAHYHEHEVEADVSAFFDDISEPYAWADLVLCRSGALTVSEITAAGLAAVFVPYSYAVDDHQTRNAQYLVEAGAAYLLHENDLTINKLKVVLDQCVVDAQNKREVLCNMAMKARQLALPESARQVADVLLEEALRG